MAAGDLNAPLCLPRVPPVDYIGFLLGPGSCSDNPRAICRGMPAEHRTAPPRAALRRPAPLQGAAVLSPCHWLLS